jgi:aminoglycoside phosphotransferase (APT) family kinase protein
MSLDITGALGDYLTGELATPVAIRAAQRVAMGQSRAMYVVDAELGATPTRLVVRVEQHGLLGTDSAPEVGVMRALHRAGFPVAEVIAYEPTGAVLGQPFFVMTFLPGVSTPDEATIDEYLEWLVRLHELDVDSLDLDFLDRPDPGTGAALAQVDRWERTYRSGLLGEPSPLVEEAIAWLRSHAPATERCCLVHADPGPGNYLHESGRVVALVDWEFAHIGDEYDDWAYLITMRGATVMPTEAWIERIRSVTGIDLDPERLRYWEAVKFLMGASIDQTAMRLYCQGVEVAPNLLAIGTGIHLMAVQSLYDTIFACP